MDFEKEEVLTLDNGSEYIVVDNFTNNNKNYVFLVGKDKKDLNFVEYKDNTFLKIEDDNEFELAFNTLYDRNKERIKEALKEK